ncbi:hypothetical protein IMZ08_03760 [Bacillus luteolus]|uniref:DUF5305 domain-containing protein n=1 Tax=Litchfieldia luteola TaxID=682179 RepID=A0ABR9QFA7_9BACI|nr:DUF5305 family protein [Cytobacillus luteolus]MBE4907174.1 hypothetical protein [Cytobacillus luteolus]MBP1943355.1 hypothetical protein [Cytobacillus luteolus]
MNLETQKSTFKPARKKGFFILVSVWVILLFTTFYTLVTPTTIKQETLENLIQDKTIFSYSVDSKPSTLYPEGGLISPPPKVVIGSITNSIDLSVDKIIVSNEPIQVEGTYKVILKVIAEEIWEKEFNLVEEQEFKTEGINLELINETFKVDPQAIQDFIEQTEKEVKVSGKYSVQVIPVVEGFITYRDNVYALDKEGSVLFNYQSYLFSLQNETLEFDNVSEVMNTIEHLRNFQLFGIQLEWVTLRLALLIITPLLFIPIMLLYRTIKPLGLRQWITTKRDRKKHIDNKYKSHIIQLTEKPDMENMKPLHVPTIDDLIRLADEKELSVFTYKEKKDQSIYFILDGNFTYLFKSSLATSHSSEMEEL